MFFKSIHSAILAFCQAKNLTAQLSCNTNTLTLMWAQSQLQGTTYILQTEMVGSNLPPSLYTTTNTSHTLTHLLCGRRYAFRIAVQDGQSHSSYSPATRISTGKNKITWEIHLQFSLQFSVIDSFTFLVCQLPVSLPTSQLALTVGQTMPISPGLKQVMLLSTLLR